MKERDPWGQGSRYDKNIIAWWAWDNRKCQTLAVSEVTHSSGLTFSVVPCSSCNNFILSYLDLVSSLLIGQSAVHHFVMFHVNVSWFNNSWFNVTWNTWNVPLVMSHVICEIWTYNRLHFCPASYPLVYAADTDLVLQACICYSKLVKPGISWNT